MKISKLLILLLLSTTLFYAKTIEGTFKLNQFRDNSGNSFDVKITVKYKIESLMGDPVVKATAKYEIGQFIDIDGKTYTKDDLTKEQRSKLKIYDLYITVPFDTTYNGQGTNTLYIDMSMGAMGSVGEWSFNPPETPDWDKWIYVNQYQYLTKEEAKKAYRGLKRLGYGSNAYDSLAMVKKIKYSLSDVKMEQPLKDIWVDKETGLMWQDEELTKKEYNAYLKDKEYKKAGNWFHAKEYCQNLTLNDFNDWRVPTINELDEIKDKREHFKYKKTFRNIWSQTSKINGGLCFSFNEYDSGNKDIWAVNKNNIYFIKCVRDTK